MNWTPGTMEYMELFIAAHTNSNNTMSKQPAAFTDLQHQSEETTI